MKLLEYIRHFDDLKPNIRTAFITGAKFGMWTAGIVIFINYITHFKNKTMSIFKYLLVYLVCEKNRVNR